MSSVGLQQRQSAVAVAAAATAASAAGRQQQQWQQWLSVLEVCKISNYISFRVCNVWYICVYSRALSLTACMRRCVSVCMSFYVGAAVVVVSHCMT